MTNKRAIILLSQMYLPNFDDEEKDALTKAIESLTEQEPKLMDGNHCPSCRFSFGWAVDELGGTDNIDYCPHCGQAVKWYD